MKRKEEMEPDNNLIEYLKNEEKKFRLLYENSPLAYQSLDSEGCFIEVNIAWLELLGYEYEEVIGRSFAEFLPPEHKKLFHERFPKFKASGTVSEIPFEMVKKDGKVIHVEIDGKIGYDREGNFKQTHCVLHDVTREKKRAELLRESQEMLFNLSENLEEVFWVGSPDWQAVYFISKYYEKVWGRTCQSMYESPMTWMEAVLPEDRPKVDLSIKRIIESGYTVNRFDDYRIVRTDGEVRWILAKVFPVRDKEGNAVKIAGIARDITDQKKLTERLSAARDLLVRTGRIGKIGGWEIDCETKELTWSEETYRIHEVPVGQLPSIEDAVNFFHPDERPGLTEAIQRAMDRGEPYDMELRFITAKGRHLWTHTICEPVVVDGRVVKLNGIFQDITEQKEVRQRLQEVCDKYKQLYERSLDGIVTCDMEGRISGLNESFAAMLGYSREELMGKNFQALTPEKWHDMEKRIVEDNIIKKGYSGLYEKEYIKKDGTLLPVELSSYLVEDSNGNATGMWGIARDIAERKRKEEELKASELEFRETFEQAAVGMAHVSIDGHWLKVNKKLCEVTGYTEEELLTKTFQEITHPDDLDKDLAFVGQLLKGEIKTYSMEKRYFRKDGSIIWVNLTVALTRKADGSPDHFISVIEDIIQRKKFEKDLLESERRLKEAQRVASIGSWEWNAQEDAVFWSDETYRIFGVSPGEFTPTFEGILGFIPEEERKDYRARVDKAMNLKDKFEYGFDIVTKNQGKKSLMIQGEVNLDDEGRPHGMWGTVQDVTERQKVIRDLKDRERYLKLLLKSMFNAFVLFESVFDEKGNFVSYRFVYINEAYERITGVKNEEVRGKTVHEIWPGTEPEWIKRYGEVAVTGKTRTFELYHDPTKKLYFCNVYRPWDNNERFCVVFEDITERKKAEEALRESEKRYKSLFQNAVDGIFIMEFSPEPLEVVRKTKRSGGVFIECNDMMLSIFAAADRDYIIGKSPEDVSPPEQSGGKPSYELAYEKLKAAFEGEAQIFEWEHLKPDGAVFYVRVSLNRLELGDDVFVQAILRDITKQKEFEEEIKALAKFPSENPFPVMRITKEGMLTHANEAAGPILDKWGTKVGGQVPGNWHKLLVESTDSGMKTMLEVIETVKDTYYSLFLAPVEETGYVNVYGMDVTERRKAEKKLAQYHNKLENLVMERTQELEERVKDLEIFHDAAVDRELKMEELRKKIKELEARSGENEDKN